MPILEHTPYRGWQNCYRYFNSEIEMVITADVGPRIIRFGFTGEENEFVEFDEHMGLSGGDTWRSYGGHRLWHAPEEQPRTYHPDNSRAHILQHDGFVRAAQDTESTTGIQKEMDIYLGEGNTVRIVHRLTNHNLWAVEFAPWAISVMAPGGTAIVPMPPRGEHPHDLLPVNTLTMWSYTDMSDPRWTWGRNYVLLRQDVNAQTPQKFGAMVSNGWAAYARNQHLFLKTFPFVPGGKYADLGSSVEIFTNKRMLEVETLSPLVSVPPGGSAEHVEQWHLFNGIPTPHNDAGVEEHIAPLVQKIGSI